MIELHHGDCLDFMRTMEPDSVDAVITDPPYGLGFMGKDWDYGVPGISFWVEALRVAKPGAHLLAFGGTRTYHRLTCAIEDAGWEIRDCIAWVYGSGFPKSHNVGKAIDKMAGVERSVTQEGITKAYEFSGKFDQAGSLERERRDLPATPEAIQWDGWGTALKPAMEPIVVARKPLIGTVASNVMKYGTGAINIDGCRIGVEPELAKNWERSQSNSAKEGRNSMNGGLDTIDLRRYTPSGRWPANLIHDGSEEVLALFPETKSGAHILGRKNGSNAAFGKDLSGVNNYDIPSSSGSAARFFYCAKASKRDRDEGCEGMELKLKAQSGGAQGAEQRGDEEYKQESIGLNRITKVRNNHPTVKPNALMRYLCKLVTPPNGIILDPFMGSGSTGKAAIQEGYNFIGCDIEMDYVKIAEKRTSETFRVSQGILT